MSVFARKGMVLPSSEVPCVVYKNTEHGTISRVEPESSGMMTPATGSIGTSVKT